jgi:hypothetical protein
MELFYHGYYSSGLRSEKKSELVREIIKEDKTSVQNSETWPGGKAISGVVSPLKSYADTLIPV